MNLDAEISMSIACLGLACLSATAAPAQSSPVNDQITQHEQKLAEARAAHAERRRSSADYPRLSLPAGRQDAEGAGMPQPGSAH